jgi:hypothetical protein
MSRGAKARIGLYFLVLAVFLTYWVPSHYHRSRQLDVGTFIVRELGEIAQAQETFRENDRDGNGIKDYWRRDVAGLYGLLDKNGFAIRLIAAYNAIADDRRVVSLPKEFRFAAVRGYCFRAIRFFGEKEDNPDRFAVCAFPPGYPTPIGETFIIAQDRIVYAKDIGHGSGIEIYPENPIKEGWVRVEYVACRACSVLEPASHEFTSLHVRPE